MSWNLLLVDCCQWQWIPVRAESLPCWIAACQPSLTVVAHLPHTQLLTSCSVMIAARAVLVGAMWMLTLATVARLLSC